MSMDWAELGIVAFVSLLLAVWLGRIYQPRPGGLSETDTREVLAVVIVVAALIMVGMGRQVPEWLILAFGTVITEIIRKGRAEDGAPRYTIQPRPTAPAIEPTGPKSGQVSFRMIFVMAAVAMLGLGLCVGLSGCGVTSMAVGGVQTLNDKIAEKYGRTNELADLREALAEKEAERTGRVLLPKDATIFADEQREVVGDRLLTNGVYSRRVYEVRAVVAPPVRTSPPPPASVIADSPAVPTPVVTTQPATNNPAPFVQAGATAAVTTASSLVESRIYTVEGTVTKSEGTVPFQGASVVAEITVAGSIGWAEAGGAVEIAGRVLSISNSPLPLDTVALTFDQFSGTVAGGVLSVRSNGGDVTFTGTADMTNGNVSAVLLPTPGTAAVAFFQRLEVSGQARMDMRTVQAVTTAVEAVTNAPPPVKTTDEIDVAGFRSLGKHSKMNPEKIRVTRTLHSARIEGGNVRISFDPLGWSSNSGGNGKSVDGAVLIAWQEGDHWTGGHFDWHGTHQTVKTLGNIPGGYLDGKQPPHGAPVAFCLVNLEGNERTNFVLSQNTW